MDMVIMAMSFLVRYVFTGSRVTRIPLDCVLFFIFLICRPVFLLSIGSVSLFIFLFLHTLLIPVFLKCRFRSIIIYYFGLSVPNAWLCIFVREDTHSCAIVRNDILGPVRINDHGIINTDLLGVRVEPKQLCWSINTENLL